MRSTQKHQYGQCLYKDKLEFFRLLFSAFNEFIVARDSSEKENKLKNVQNKASGLQCVVTTNSAVAPRDVLSLCCGFAVAVNRAINLEQIDDLWNKINLYKLLLMLARREMSADKLSASTLKRLAEFPFYKHIAVSYPYKNIDKDVEIAIATLRDYLKQNNRQSPNDSA
jgi:hypothetical protein